MLQIKDVAQTMLLKPYAELEAFIITQQRSNAAATANILPLRSSFAKALLLLQYCLFAEQKPTEVISSVSAQVFIAQLSLIYAVARSMTH
jgi:hypothetical protein